MRKKINLIKLIRMWGIIFLIGPGAAFVTIDVIRSYLDFNSRAEQIRTDSADRQKQLIRQEVGHVVDMIRNEKAQSERLTREKIQSRVYEAYAIAKNIYERNQASESKAKIQQMILDALRPIRFENGTGYYFITGLDGVEVLFADRPQMEGMNLLDMQDTHGQYVIKDMIEIAKAPGEGFTEYYWTKPASAGNDFKKISFVKRFEPFNWFIGTGLYVQDVESQVNTKLLSAISRIRFGKDGYFFVNRFNGDTLVTNGRVFSGEKKLWEIFTDNPEKIKTIFGKEYQAALTPGGDFIYYSWIKLNSSDEESPKTSFVYGIPEFQWLVGAGVYLDDEETHITLMQLELTDRIKSKLHEFIGIIIGIIGLFYLFFNFLSRRLQKDIDFFISFFNRAARSDEEINRENIKFIELDQMAEYANEMLAERRQTEEEREKLRMQLNQARKMESVGRLAGGVAHDFNNMLGVITGYTELAMDSAAPESPIGHALKQILSAARRSADITRQLLAFARKQTIAPKVLDLNETVEGMLKMIRRLIGENIDLAWSPGANLWLVRMDPSQIDQMLANLCVNARDAIADVGRVTIETDTATFDKAYCADHAGSVPGEYVLLAVSDDGSGMTPETLENLFEPFFTTKEVGKGTGLGLATVYGIVKQNNGFINVYSEPEKGTIFKIYLPRHDSEAAQIRKNAPAAPDATGSETILLVEDEPAILGMATMMLEKLGYTVLGASTTGEAIRLFRGHGGEIHLLMTDVIMPEMNGRDLANKLLPLHPGLKRLFMSGYTADVIAHHGVLDQGVHFIQKPFSRQDLAKKVREVLDET